MTSSQHAYEVRPRKDKRGYDLISEFPGNFCLSVHHFCFSPTFLSHFREAFLWPNQHSN
jgi:hypothetical protein